MERRPISARNTPWAQRVAEALARTRLTPNAISVWGMVSCLLAGLAFAATNRDGTGPEWPWWVAGGILVQVRLLANLFDGMVAQIQKSASPVGELYNEVPDRISDVATLVGLGYAAGSDPALGYVASLGAVLTAYVRAQLAVAGTPQDYRGPMAKPHRMTVVTIGALATAVLGSGFALGGVTVAQATLAVIATGSAATAWRRLQSGASLLRRGISD